MVKSKFDSYLKYNYLYADNFSCSDKMNSVRPTYLSLFIYKIFNHSTLRTGATLLHTHQHCSIFCFRPTSARNFLENVPKCTQRFFCSQSDKQDQADKHRERVREELKAYLKQHRVRLRDTEQRIKETSNVIIKDIRETKEKVKERVEEIIEVSVVITALYCVGFFRFRVVERKRVYNTKFVVRIEDFAVSLSWHADRECTFQFRLDGIGYRRRHRPGKLI